MSDPTGKSLHLAWRSESARASEGVREQPPELSVTGEVRVRVEQSERAVRFDDAQLDQLALALSQRLAEPKARWTFGELAARWLTKVQRVRLHDEQRAIVQLKPLWGLREPELTHEAITDWFNHLVASGYSPVSVNKYRSAGRLAIQHAQANQQWGGANPFELVKRLKEPKRSYELLTLDEVKRVLPHFRADHRRMFRVSMVLGLRPGELFALRKEDISFDRGLVYVRRSHARDTTKTGTPRTLPLLSCIAGDVLEAIRESPSQLLFPAADGELKRADTKSCRLLHAAMRRAGVVTGWTFTCRAPGCEWTMSFAGPCDDMLCPTHGWKALRNGTVKKVRWYDARHMAASFHRLAGADRLAVKLLLGHGGDITDDVYTHMGEDWVRRELSRFVL